MKPIPCPAAAIALAKREANYEEVADYCVNWKLDEDDIARLIETACGVVVDPGKPECPNEDMLAGLDDEQVEMVVAHIRQMLQNVSDLRRQVQILDQLNAPKGHLEQALDILEAWDDQITGNGGDDDPGGRYDLARIRRLKSHLRKLKAGRA